MKRMVVANIANVYFRELWETPLQDLVREGGDFAVDLMEQMKQHAGK